MSSLPGGTVTFLFTDIEGSTRLLHELGIEYRTALEDHRRLLRDAFGRHGGHEVDTQGDAFFVAFRRAQDAARAARDAQRALAGHPWPGGRALRVRMGLHTCEATATDEGYVGVGVHRGARICSVGHGGQVLLSHTTRDLLDEEDTGFRLDDLGEHRIKDLTQPQRLFQLAGDGLPSGFPALRTLENRPTNLPVQPTPLLGREREVEEIAALLMRDDVRLVTLTGPGGTGKTRLALQAGADLLERFPDGVFFVALAAIVDPDLVVPTIAQTLGINETSGQSLLGYLSDKRMLLVLDNLEQVLPSASDLADLLGRLPELNALATSREPLHVAPEHVYPVDALEKSASVLLFTDRAKAVQPTFAATREEEEIVAEICARLDGLPLAIELAAARVTLLSPDSMLERLGERLKLLTAGARDLPARQQTMRDTLAWSYDLLDVDERSLFARLSVFAGGFTLEAAEAVCNAELDLLASLVDKSLVRREGERFRMLETIREYSLEELANTGQKDDLRKRHAEYFLELAEEAYSHRIEQEAGWSERLEAEHDNVRAALEWLKTQDPERELELAGALGWFWFVRSHLTEGRARLAGVLERDRRGDRLEARALAAAGTLAAWQGDIDSAETTLEVAIGLWGALGESVEQALSLESLGWGYFFAGDDPSARTHFEHSLELQRRGGDKRLVNRAQLAVCQILVSQGDLEPAERLAREALTLGEEQDDAWAQHLAYHFMADCALIGEDYDAAEEGYTRSLRAAVALGNRTEIAIELQGVAMAAGGRGYSERAVRLNGAAEQALADLGLDISGVAFWNVLVEQHIGRARAHLGNEAAVADQKGRRLTLDEAVEAALDVEEVG